MKTRGTGKFTSYKKNPSEIIRAHQKAELDKEFRKMQKFHNKFEPIHDYKFFMHTEEPKKGKEPKEIEKKKAPVVFVGDKRKKAVKGKKASKKSLEQKKESLKTKKLSKRKKAEPKKSSKRIQSKKSMKRVEPKKSTRRTQSKKVSKRSRG